MISAAAVLIITALAIASALNLGPLSTVSTDDGCWHKIQQNNLTFDSEKDLRNYASERGVSIPSNATFKIINGTLYQEAKCVGEITSG